MRGEAPEPLATVLSERADWHDIADRPYHFVAMVAGIPCELRLNDFPEENLATLWVRGEQHELEDLPAYWRLLKHRAE